MTSLTQSRTRDRFRDVDDVVICTEDAQSVLAGIDGVLELIEKQSENSEDAFNAFCLLCLVRGQLEGVLIDAERG